MQEVFKVSAPMEVDIFLHLDGISYFLQCTTQETFWIVWITSLKKQIWIGIIRFELIILPTQYSLLHTLR